MEAALPPASSPVPPARVGATLPLRQRVIYSFATVGSGAFNGFFNSTMPLFLSRHYALDNWLLGLLAQERSFLGSLLEPVVGWLSDRTNTRFGRRRPYLLIGAPLAALGLAVLSQVPPMAVMVMILLFLPVMLAISLVPYRAMLVDIADPEARGGVGGTMAVMEMIGQIGLALLAKYMWDQNQTLVFFAVIFTLLFTFPVTFALIREPVQAPRPRTVETRSAATENPRVEPTRGGALVGVMRALRTGLRYLLELASFREAAKWVVAQILFWLAIGGISPFVTRYASMELGLGDSAAITLFLFLIIFTAIFAVPMGIAGDRLGKKRVLAAALFVFGCAILVGSQVNTYEQLAAVLIVAGAANAATTALGFPFLTELLPKHRMGELTGFSGMTWSFAQPLGSVLAGGLADVTGTLRSSLVLAALLLFASLAILLFVHPERVVVAEP